MKRVLGGMGLGLALVFLPGVAAQAAPTPAMQDSPGSPPSANHNLGVVGDLVTGLAGGAGPLGFLLPSPNGSGANFITGR